MKGFRIIYLLLILFSCHQLSAQKLSNAEEIISNSAKAMFGKTDLSMIKSIYVEAYYHGREVPNKSTVLRPDKFINKTRMGDLVFDGKRVGLFNRKPDKEGNAQHDVLVDSTNWLHFYIDIALIFPGYFDYPTKLMGVEDADGKDAYKLYVEFPLGGKIFYYLDCESFLPIKRVVHWDGNLNNAPWVNWMNEYKDYNGIKFPAYFLYKSKDGMEKAVYKNFKVNIAVDNNTFKIPNDLPYQTFN